jgi:hypothetical protein
MYLHGISSRRSSGNQPPSIACTMSTKSVDVTNVNLKEKTQTLKNERISLIDNNENLSEVQK